MKYKKEILFMLGGGIFGNLSGKALDYANNKKLNEFQNTVVNSLNSIGKNNEALSNQIDKLSESFLDKIFQFITEKVKIFIEKSSTASEILNREGLSDKFHPELNDNLSKAINAAGELNKFLEDWNSKNKFFSDFNLDFFYGYLDSLSLLEELALLHLIFFIIFIIIITNITAALFGNEIIKYFDLEKKYPKLNTFFSYRAKFQKYYLIWNLFQMFLLCILGLVINLLFFI